MESQPQNPEFRNNPENSHVVLITYTRMKVQNFQNPEL